MCFIVLSFLHGGYFNLSILGLILGPNQRLYVLLSEGCVEIKAIDAHVLRN